MCLQLGQNLIGVQANFYESTKAVQEDAKNIDQKIFITVKIKKIDF